jgi:membrane-associated HD superfamily phosphohydrolase
MNELIVPILGAGLMMILLVVVVCLLVFTFAFQYSAIIVAKEDLTFWMSLAIVVLGGVAFGGVNLPVSFLMDAVGLPEIAVAILGFIISFCATSCVYFLMLKTNFWKASLIQIATLIISLILVGGLRTGISLF